jgi:hypothetical protein
MIRFDMRYFKADNFLHGLRIRHEINELSLNSLTRLLQQVEL